MISAHCPSVPQNSRPRYRNQKFLGLAGGGKGLTSSFLGIIHLWDGFLMSILRVWKRRWSYAVNRSHKVTWKWGWEEGERQAKQNILLLNSWISLCQILQILIYLLFHTNKHNFLNKWSKIRVTEFASGYSSDVFWGNEQNTFKKTSKKHLLKSVNKINLGRCASAAFPKSPGGTGNNGSCPQKNGSPWWDVSISRPCSVHLLPESWGLVGFPGHDPKRQHFNPTSQILI